MPKFEFEIPIKTESKAAFEKIKKFFSSTNDLTKYDAKLKCTYDDKNLICNINGSQFKANLSIIEKPKSENTVQVNVEVPLALALFKGKIKETIEKNIKKVLG